MATAEVMGLSPDRAFYNRLVCLHAQAALPVTRRAAQEPAPAPNRSDSERFAMQHSAICRALQRSALTGRRDAASAPTTVIEFGAGGGALSQALWTERASLGQLEFLLVDRSPPRPGRLQAGFTPRRLCVDVEGLPPDRLRQHVRGRCIALSNHMCGCALDIALRCAVSAFPAGGDGLAGVVAVSCCHHKCNWESYLGREYFGELGLGEPEFEAVRRWSAAAPRRNKPPATRQRVVQLAETLAISPDQAAELGARCRQLLDSGRAKALEQRGFAVVLEQHVDFRVTADHVMLVAVSRGPQAQRDDTGAWTSGARVSMANRYK